MKTNRPTVQGVTWNDAKTNRLRPAAVCVLATGILASSFGLAPAAFASQAVTPARAVDSVVVRATPGHLSDAAASVRAAGGTVKRQMAALETLSATVPDSALDILRRAAGVASVSVNGKVELADAGSTIGTYNEVVDPNSVYNSLVAMGAPTYYRNGITGKGVDVAVIDSGVSTVQGLDAPGKVVKGPDLSEESQAPNLAGQDTHGHGTFMAGLVAGKDVGWSPTGDNSNNFGGAAPDARIVAVKAADAFGVTDVSQVLAGIDWVVQHKNDNGMNIRVLNLSFGTDSDQSYLVDPLTYAVEVAWRQGIFVVVSAGNHGDGTSRNTMTDPATDPFVLSVGAEDTTSTTTRVDDTIPSFSSWGTANRAPDLVAPGRSVTSLRVPGSNVDLAHPEGRVGERFFKGSGTSQAAAYASGAAALVIQQRPGITPDQLKDLFVRSALKLNAADPVAQGAGGLDLKKAYDTATNLLAVQSFTPATGLGSLDKARGSSRLSLNGHVLDGERDFLGGSFDSTTWAAKALAGTTWQDGKWNGVTFTGNGFAADGSGWSSVGWSSVGWSGVDWSSVGWSSVGWSSVGWSSVGWSSVGWSSVGWSSVGWSSVGWSSVGWSSVGWSSVGWSSDSWGV